MDELQEFIRTTTDVRELKRALVVHNTLIGRSRSEVAAEVGYSVAFVDKWRGIYKRQGVEGLRVGYKGSTGYLTPQHHDELRGWIQAQKAWDIPTLQAHIAHQYDVHYKSLKSYYALMDEAGISWKKSQDDHPDADPVEVEQTREQIKKNDRDRSGVEPEAGRHALY